MQSLFTVVLAAASLSAQQPAARTAEQNFATAQEAAQALVDAADSNDSAALVRLFGSADIADSGDAAQDKASRAEFARRAHEKLQVKVEPANVNRATIITGVDNWPFPVPLIRAKSGQWHFDSARGRTEILARRIGRNELVAIDVVRGYVEAQMEYAAHDRAGNGTLVYAQHIVSSPGKRDGLYWDGEQSSLVPKSFADAADTMLTAGKRVPYHGYYFHILTAQGPDAPGGAHSYLVNGRMIGGFALIAYPANYGVTGIKSFIVNHSGAVYEKDLGPATGAVAHAMTRFNPDRSWHAIEGE